MKTASVCHYANAKIPEISVRFFRPAYSQRNRDSVWSCPVISVNKNLLTVSFLTNWFIIAALLLTYVKNSEKEWNLATVRLLVVSPVSSDFSSGGRARMYKYHIKALCPFFLHDFKGFQLVSISVSFCDLGVEPYQTQDLVKLVQRRLYQDIFFKIDGEIGTGTSFGGRSFNHCFVKRVERLRIFILREKAELLNCFVWNYREPGNIHLVGCEFVVVWFLFVLA